MPKKLQTNQKAADARARKDALKQAEKERIQKVKDDEYWRDDDKQLAKKQARKEEKERKEAEERERKKEREKLLQEELANIKGKESSDNKAASNKVTRSQIEKNLSNMAAAANAATPKNSRIVQEDFGTVENLNKVPGATVGARTVDEAINLMANLDTGGDASFDRHPERRQKAAWEAFESARLPVLKAENQNLRLSQLRQMIRKEWQKSPENPLNARILAYNAKKAQVAAEAEDEDSS